MLIGAGQEAPAPAPATPQQRVAAPWPHGGGEDVGEGMLGAVFPFWPEAGYHLGWEVMASPPCSAFHQPSSPGLR